MKLTHLKCCSRHHCRVCFPPGYIDALEDEEDVEQGQTNHRHPEGEKFEVTLEEERVVLASIEEVHNDIASVAPGVQVGSLAPVRLKGHMDILDRLTLLKSHNDELVRVIHHTQPDETKLTVKTYENVGHLGEDGSQDQG